MRLKAVWEFLKRVVLQWLDDQPFQLAASLSYYALFSLAPLLTIAIAVAGLVFSREAAQNEIVQALQGLIGPESARAVQALIENASKRPGNGVLSALLGLLLLLLGAGGVVGQLQNALNTIWGVTPKSGQAFWAFIRQRILSLAMVLAIGFLLLVSLVISALLAALTQLLGALVGGAALAAHFLDVLLSFALVALLFAMIYKFLPDVRIRWKDVWIGAALTSLLFAVGKSAIGLYLGTSGVASSYGAAGSVVTILLWVYYSSLILFLGAEFTQVYASRYGSGVVPTAAAEPISAARKNARRKSPPPERRSG